MHGVGSDVEARMKGISKLERAAVIVGLARAGSSGYGTPRQHALATGIALNGTANEPGATSSASIVSYECCRQVTCAQAMRRCGPQSPTTLERPMPIESLPLRLLTTVLPCSGNSPVR